MTCIIHPFGQVSILLPINVSLFSRHYVFDTGKCSPKEGDNWWILDNNGNDNEMINYMQIKQWGPYIDRKDTYIREDVLW